MKRARRSALPGLRLNLGLTMFYLLLIVLIPLSTLFGKVATLSFHALAVGLTSPRVLASFKLSFGASFIAASINAVLGFVIAWALVRYEFPAKRLVDALIDLPFALPTAVAGIALTTAYSENGWIGRHLVAHGIDVAFTPLGVTLALSFVGLPFVVRTVQPVLEELEEELDEAAASLGATRAQTFIKVTLPLALPSLLSGFGQAFARAVGEYGSVVFISGNMPMKTEIVPLLIMTRLEQYDYAGATALATAMLIVSFALLLVINRLQASSRVSETERDEPVFEAFASDGGE